MRIGGFITSGGRNISCLDLRITQITISHLPTPTPIEEAQDKVQSTPPPSNIISNTWATYTPYTKNGHFHLFRLLDLGAVDTLAAREVAVEVALLPPFPALALAACYKKQ